MRVHGFAAALAFVWALGCTAIHRAGMTPAEREADEVAELEAKHHIRPLGEYASCQETCTHDGDVCRGRALDSSHDGWSWQNTLNVVRSSAEVDDCQVRRQDCLRLCGL